MPQGKEPLTAHGFLDATTDVDQIRAWWHATPEANIAVPTGRATVDVLDVDVRPDGDGWDAFQRLGDAGLLHGAGAMVDTPSGGLHVYFAGTDQRSAKLPGHHLDFKAAGGYVLVPPSYVVTDHYAGAYTVRDARPLAAAQPLDWAACRRLLDPPRPRPIGGDQSRATDPGRRLDALARFVAGLGEGNRNDGLYWAACRAVAEGLDP